jgi:hypothetical protein
MSKDKRDRITIDISGLRDRIAIAHEDNPIWIKLSLSEQIRTLLTEACDLAEKQRKNVDSSEPNRENEGSEDW